LYGAEGAALFQQEPAQNGTASGSIAKSIMMSSKSIDEDNSVSWGRLKRKLMIKILQSKLNKSDKDKKTKPTKFVWATGGHSAAAGHGNLFKECYTMVLGQFAKPVFEAIGLDFEVRPFAMGATGSTLEISGCVPQVFGTDVDFFYWDYGMTTGSCTHCVSHWVQRAALLETIPAFGFDSRHFADVMKETRDQGFGVFHFNRREHDTLAKTFAKSSGMSLEEMNQKMPPNIRGMNCDKRDNVGSENCKDTKWSKYDDPNEPCNKRMHQQGWHPGWQAHALIGHILAQFLLEVLDDALREIHTNAQASDPQVFLDSLVKQQLQDVADFRAKKFKVTWPFEKIEKKPELSNDVIFKQPNYCSIARMPAQMRYEGILLGGPKDGDFMDYSTYDRGHKQTEEFVFGAPHEKVEVMWTEGVYQAHCTKDMLQIDHPDWFLGATQNTTPTLILPSDREIEAYGDYTQQLVGYVSYCRAWPGAGFDKKKELEVLNYDDSFDNGGYNITVNGHLVVDFIEVEGCIFLAHKGGYKFPKNNQGRFEFQFFTNLADKYVRFTTVMVW